MDFQCKSSPIGFSMPSANFTKLKQYSSFIYFLPLIFHGSQGLYTLDNSDWREHFTRIAGFVQNFRSNDSCTFSDTLIIKRDNLMILLRMRYLHAQHSSCMKKHKILSNPSMNSMPQGLLVWHSGGREDLIMYNVETMSQWTLDLAAICFERQPLRCSHLNAHTSWRCF